MLEKKDMPSVNPPPHKGLFVSDYPTMIEKWDYKKNSGVDITKVAAGSNKSYYWRCNAGHSYPSTPKIQRNCGCTVCAGKIVIRGVNDLETLEPDISKEWDYSRNEKQPYEFTRSSGAMVYWKCTRCGHSWPARINNRTSHHTGCPNCSTSKQTSFPEQALFYYIKQLYPNASNRIRLKDRLTLDIFVSEIRLAIEYNGYAWHNNSEQRKRDARKRTLCEESDIRLITVSEEPEPCKIVFENNIIHYYRDKNESNLNCALCILLSNVLQEEDVDIDVVRDKMQILGLYLNQIQEKSVEERDPSLAREWDYESNYPLTPDRVSSMSNLDVAWICPKGHRYPMTVDKRSQGRNCPYCSDRKLLIGFNDFETWCLENGKERLLMEWAKDKNTEPPSHYMRGRKKNDIVWKCSACGNEWRASIIDRAHGKGCPECFKARRYKRVGQYDADGEMIREYDTVSEAARLTGIALSSISAVCRGTAKTAGGFKWRFISD